MRTIEQTVYEFSELSDRAKETAREWWRRDQDFDLEHTIDDAATVADLFGHRLKVPIPTPKGQRMQ